MVLAAVLYSLDWDVHSEQCGARIVTALNHRNIGLNDKLRHALENQTKQATDINLFQMNRLRSK